LWESHEQIEEYNLSLEDKVKERTRELEQANEEIKQSQEQLVQSEKMASLGQLVAGVAHEMGTPLGIGLTAASHATDITGLIRNAFDTKDMTKEMLEKYFVDVDESCQLIMSNLERTGDLVKNFKQVAADQVSHERRLFNLGKYLDSIVVSMSPKLRTTGQSVHITCPEGLLIDSYPGAFAQIISNFIMNSLIHAYDKRDPGTINISVTSGDESTVLTYEDNGRGIPKDIIDKVFDPFVTTRRGEGGTGLGLNIVYNIVTQTMGGTICCESEEGKGAKFVIILPFEGKKEAIDN